MSRCLNCRQLMQYSRDFCKETCQQEYFAERESEAVNDDESEDETE